MDTVYEETYRGGEMSEEEGKQWELWGRYQGSAAEYIDVCTEDDKDYIVGEYKVAFGEGWTFEWREEK